MPRYRALLNEWKIMKSSLDLSRRQAMESSIAQASSSTSLSLSRTHSASHSYSRSRVLERAGSMEATSSMSSASAKTVAQLKEDLEQERDRVRELSEALSKEKVCTHPMAILRFSFQSQTSKITSAFLKVLDGTALPPS